MFEVDWGLDPQSGVVIDAATATAVSRAGARCPCCRHWMMATPERRFRHGAGTCTPTAVLLLLAMRAGLATLSAAALGRGPWPLVQERCVTCGGAAELTVFLAGGGPGGGGVVWVGPGGALVLGAAPGEASVWAGGVWVQPTDLLVGRWWASPRRKCASCAAADADWGEAQRRWLRRQQRVQVAS